MFNEMAADQGDSGGQFSYAVYLQDGEGVTRNVSGEVRCFKMAADQGDMGGQLNYGLCVMTADGVPCNPRCDSALELWVLFAET